MANASINTVTFTTGNTQSWYATILNSTSANIITEYAQNFSTGNAVISGGYISELSNATFITGNVSSWYATTLNVTSANITTGNIKNFSTANAVITGGYINNLANLTSTTSYATNFSTGNAVISGGYISSLSNAVITTANLGSINFAGTTISSIAGNVTISPLLSDGNGTVIIGGTSALQLPSGTTAERPVAINAGSIRWNNTSFTLEYYNGSGWASLINQISNQSITPDGVNASFTLNYSTTAEGIIVSINGTLQQPGVAYTVVGSQITFSEVPLDTDIISIRYIASGTVTAENALEVNSANIALTTTPIIIDTFDQNAYRSAKYMATTTAASSAEFAEFAVVQMGAVAAVSNVNRVITGSTLTTFISNISGTTVRLWANTVTGTANIRLQKSYFVI